MRKDSHICHNVEQAVRENKVNIPGETKLKGQRARTEKQECDPEVSVSLSLSPLFFSNLCLCLSFLLSFLTYSFRPGFLSIVTERISIKAKTSTWNLVEYMA